MRKVIGFYKEEAPELYNAMIGERDKVRSLSCCDFRRSVYEPFVVES